MFNFNTFATNSCLMKNAFIYLIFCFTVLLSCKTKNEVQIETNTTQFFSKVNYLFSANSNFNVSSFEWKIVELDSIISTEKEASISFPKKGTYTLLVKAKGKFGKSAVTEKSIIVNPSNGYERMIWSHLMGARYEISFWAYGTKYDGTAYFDSVYFDSMAGPQLHPSSTCAQLSNAPSLNLPGGNYTIYYKYKTQPINPFLSGSYSIEMDGNCK